MMSLCFVGGWVIFPIAWTLGPPGMGYIGIDVQVRAIGLGLVRVWVRVTGLG